MIRLSPRRLAVLGTVLLLAVSLGSALAAANNVSNSRLDKDTLAITANDLKPNACNALSLGNVVTGSGAFDGTSGNDLILGSSGADPSAAGRETTASWRGAGDDIVQGNQGTTSSWVAMAMTISMEASRMTSSTGRMATTPGRLAGHRPLRWGSRNRYRRRILRDDRSIP